MAARRLSELEEARREEEAQAKAWAEKHGIGQLPGARFDNGESAGPQHVEPEHLAVHEGDAQSRQVSSYMAFDDWAERLVSSTRNLFVGVAQGRRSPNAVERATRIEYVLGKMRPADADLLRAKHVQGLSLSALAEQRGCSRFSVADAVRVAEQNFRRTFALHYSDAEALSG